MGRGKLKLELIADESNRKTTFKKRKAGLLKKVSEIHTLCGIDTCAVIFSDVEDKPTIWPSSVEACRVLERFKSMPKKKQAKYMLNQENFLSQSLTKMAVSLQKRLKRNKTLDIESLLLDCFEDKQMIANMESKKVVDDMTSYVGEKLKQITNRINFLDGNNMEVDVEGEESASGDEEKEDEDEDAYESDDSDMTM